MNRPRRVFRNPFRTRAIDVEVEEEFSFHIERRVQALVESGMSPSEARSEAERRFGTRPELQRRSTRERIRTRRGRTARDRIGDLLREFGRIGRSLAKNPLPSGLAVGILAIGIGVSTAGFSVVQGLLTHPVAHAKTDDLYYVESSIEAGELPIDPPTYVAWTENQSTLDAFSAFQVVDYSILREGAPNVQWRGAAVSSDFFAMLGIPIFGPGLGAQDDGSNGVHGIVLGHRVWTDFFAADSAVIGAVLTGENYQVGRVSMVVAGIAPPGLRYPYDAKFWVPLRPHIEDNLTTRGQYLMGGLARPAAGRSVSEIEAELGRLAPDPDIGAHLTPLNEYISGDLRQPLRLLFVAVALVLLIACANVGNLLLTRTTKRSKELGVRSALGASRGRLVLGFWEEGLAVAMAGGLLGVLIAYLSIDILRTVGESSLAALEAVRIDLPTLLFALGVTIFAALAASIVPILRFHVAGLAPALRAGAGDSGPTLFRSGLVAAQLALTLMLLSGSTVVIKSVRNILAVDPGFETSGRIAFDLGGFLRSSYGESEAQLRLVGDLLDEIGRSPTVRDVAFTRSLPMNGKLGMSAPIRWEDASLGTPSGGAQFEAVSEGYFELMEIEALRGRTFRVDDDADAPRVTIVNRTFVDRFVPEGRDPIGMRTRTLFSREFAEIVGVVEDVRRGQLTRDPQPTLYSPYRQTPWSDGSVLVRANAPTAEVVAAVRDIIGGVAPEQPIADVQTFEAYIARSVAQPRYISWILVVFSGVALVLALAGFYAVVAARAAERRREIGIRIALGASTSHIGREFLSSSLRVIGIGTTIGLLGVFLVGRSLHGLVYGTTPTDPGALGLSIALLATLSVGATCIPALRASHTDPVEVLHADA